MSQVAGSGATQQLVSMQEAIVRLQAYWSRQGCALMQPFNIEVGAGTMNPSTILSVLGPEPWKVAYVEPSVRPDDSRYGQNPNRLQTHTQFQVILKPEPGNPQELYLGSLAALGIDLRAHDVRFVEDNWAQPAIGAWGLGWEVWLDGLEITQFTYFQQVGGQNLNPVPVEITYGLERILMAIQQVSHFKDLLYAPGVSYGEVFGQSEYEMSRYYLDDADIDTTRTLLDAYSREAARMITHELPVPAHVFVLKSSHAFNILDARGAISTAERASWFATMRDQSCEVAALWTRLREQAGYPRGVHQPAEPATAPLDPATLASAAGASLLLEIGTEELPPHVVDATITAVAAKAADLLAATALPHGTIRADATPRRIAVRVNDIAEREPDTTQTRRGPRLAAAYDSDGNPTPGLTGFLRAQGAEIADVVRVEVNGVVHVALEQTRTGRTAATVLTGVCSQLVTGLRADQNMRWSDRGLTFSRPIRWLVALLGETVLPVTAGTLTAGRTTRVDLQATRPLIEISTAELYEQELTEAGVVLDVRRRRGEVLRQAGELAAAEGGRLGNDEALIDEITNLVESPVGLLGRFDPKYLKLPQQILTTVMRKHQRYLPVLDADGKLLAMFVAIANGVCDRATTRAGNENVLRARFADAEFFWNADLLVSPAEFRTRLAGLTFAEKVGTMADRADRIAALARDLGGLIALQAAEAAALARAGQLAKFDLASHMVIELTSLAGTMAREYAAAAGETPEVATALWEMELPRHQADNLPTTTVGTLLALADRFDLLVAMFAAGAKLTGTSDSYGLRRAGLGIVRILRAHPALEPITITAGLAAAARRLRERGVPIDEQATGPAEELIRARFEQRLRDEDINPALIAAVRAALIAPARADRLIGQIRGCLDAGGQQFADLAEALQRIMRILPADAPDDFDRARLVDDAEITLSTILDGIPATTDLPGWINTGYTLVGPLRRFFDDVLVMTENLDLRAARLGLLNTVLRQAPPEIDWRDVHLLRQRSIQI